MFQRLWGLEYAVARLSNPYGPQQNPLAKQGAVTVFLGDVARGKPITIWGDGEVVRDYIYIADAAKALLRCAEYHAKPDAPRVFNVGAGEGHSLNEIVQRIKQVVDAPVEVRYTPSRPVDVPYNILDISLATATLGWTPELGLSEGLAKTWEWVKDLKLTKDPLVTVQSDFSGALHAPVVPPVVSR